MTTLLSLTDFINSKSKELDDKLIAHFDTIYECNELGDHENKIAYLAYLWKNGRVLSELNGGHTILKEEELEVKLFKDYEVTFEAGEGNAGGLNLLLFHEYYNIEKMMEIV